MLSDTCASRKDPRALNMQRPTRPPNRYMMSSANAPLIRVLVAEDFEAFRKFLCAQLLRRPDLKLVCEVSDGLEAVQKAHELKPDLILLDIGLPGLDGIEIARHIRQHAPDTKILFCTQECDMEVVQAAFNVGGHGYVFKADAGRELLLALDVVLKGERFIGNRFAAPISTGGDGFVASE